MRLSSLLLSLARFLLPPAVIASIYLYCFPLIVQCAFPPAQPAAPTCYTDGGGGVYRAAEVAPFRLLAIGDPQLEGDTALYGLTGKMLPDWESLRSGEWVTSHVPRWLQRVRKRVDLWGNDLYLAHVYRTVSWWTQPTHTVVLGDLLGSQWIDDDEFARRTERFWGKVFRGGEKVPHSVTGVSGRKEVLGQDPSWKHRIMAVAGNHDIGYAGDIDEHRIERFEAMYGNVNWDICFTLNDSSAHPPDTTPSPFSSALGISPPELCLVILNSMNLDSPAQSSDLRQQSLDFLSTHLSNPRPSNSATILLTHIPLHKEEGICVDAPFFSHFPDGSIKEQNHLSKATSTSILDGLNPGKAIILNGHDHEGCDTYHHLLSSSSSAYATVHDYISEHPDHTPSNLTWTATHYDRFISSTQRIDAHTPGLREITVRAMMGNYGGNMGLLSAWFDDEAREWKFDYDTCMLGVQHIWWGVHVLDVVVLGMGVVGFACLVWEEVEEERRNKKGAVVDGVYRKTA
ncbi:protein TED1-like [Teratosphaeria destructans]|uniref:Protein TED1-like n=1 Tax=Teratosphaeria destructans TaxID=418781 RepID=A0A9W7T1F6_9PEZI|nr:protein TED1-like [Teratosphaeria destructans]